MNAQGKPETLKIKCPGCNRTLKGVTTKMVGDIGVCNKCKTEFTIQFPKADRSLTAFSANHGQEVDMNRRIDPEPITSSGQAEGSLKEAKQPRNLRSTSLLFRFILATAQVVGASILVILAISLIMSWFCNDQNTSNIGFVACPLPMPNNGEVFRYHQAEAIAPFEIKTRPGSGHYFIKLVNYGTNQTVLTAFVHDGQSATINVPLGSYELKYAVGKFWYGSERLFGPKTSCSKADEKFDFKRIGDQVTRYTVELYLQKDGNLQTELIPQSEF
jgi:hypothetical protein